MTPREFMMTLTTREAAFAYLEAGLSIIPIRLDGSKAPNTRALPDGQWSPFQTELPTRRQVMQWFGTGSNGIAIIGGKVSGNLERIDLDAPGVLEQWLELCEQEGLYKQAMTLPQVKTPRDGWGWHVYYRCSKTTIPGNLILARTIDGKTLIETRGEGGYTIAPGSPVAVHASGRPYELVTGSLTDIPDISPDIREALLGCAYALNEYRDPRTEYKPAPPKTGDNTDLRPGDSYNAENDFREVLEKHGWVFVRYCGEVEHWRRPGKNHGISATFNHGGSRLFWPFSSNCAPFDSQTSYSPFAVLAILEHHGDFSDTARKLSGTTRAELVTHDGFIVSVDEATEPAEPEPGGTDAPTPDPTAEPDLDQENPTGPINPFADNIYTLPEWFARPVNNNWVVEPLLRRGELAFLYGAPKAGKTFVALDLLLAMVTGGQWCGKRYTVPEPGSVLLAIGEGHYGLRDRIAAACEKWQADPAVIDSAIRIIPLVPQLYPHAPDPTKHAAKFLEALGGADIHPDLLIIDTYARAILGADENSNKDASLILDTLQVLQTRLDCAVMVIHHASKGLGELRGASAILGGADIVMKCSRDGNARKLEVEFAKDIPEQSPVSFTLYQSNQVDSVYVEWGEEVSGARSLGDRILRFLADEAVMWFTAREIGEALGEETKAIIRRLWALKENGEVVQKLRNPEKPKSNGNPMEWRVVAVPSFEEEN